MKSDSSTEPTGRSARAPGTLEVAAVIVNFRTPGLAIDCLRSLVPERGRVPGLRVLLVENGSGDDSAARLGAAIAAESWGSWVDLIPSARNLGFGGGNNLALRRALAAPRRPDYALLLNTDTILRPGAVEALLHFAEEHPKVGFAGSRLEHHDATPQHSAHRFPSVAGEFERGIRLGIVSSLLARWTSRLPIADVATRVDYVAGASMLIRREVLEGVGLFDEGYFMYYEDSDLCLRARRAGWECWYVPESRVVHLVGKSSGITDWEKVGRRPRFWFDSRRRYFLENHGAVAAALADLLWIGGWALWRVRRWLLRRPDRDPPRLLLDSIANSVFVRGFRVPETAPEP